MLYKEESIVAVSLFNHKEALMACGKCSNQCPKSTVKVCDKPGIKQIILIMKNVKHTYLSVLLTGISTHFSRFIECTYKRCSS